ncbi:hypothetical protein CP970_11755 [Streptomyces kanamyceticus]|uniref:Uncharacterized protein n=1 Tax=Streptomyces kanamyceticus TaxID=1967 RepID=A0A5J6GA17_STRKN|nr:hypothetical protein CP970_11755 [Streptomyces kanamyceticus]
MGPHRSRCGPIRVPALVIATPHGGCAHPSPSSRLRSSRGDPTRPAERPPTAGAPLPAPPPTATPSPAKHQRS